MYGFWPGGLPADAVWALEAEAGAVRAERQLQRHGHAQYDPETLYELVLLATGERESAEDAMSREIHRRAKAQAGDS